MEPITLAEFKRIRWVQDAEIVGNGYRIKTKKNSLKTTLTHTIIDEQDGYGAAYDGRYREGKRLDEKVSLLLPQYWIWLKPGGFDFSFAKAPGAKAHDQIGFVPTYQSTPFKSTWDQFHGICYGSEDRQIDGTGRSAHAEYSTSKNWAERLRIAAMYLQSAEPHYGCTWYRTAYAVRLGLVGEEYVTISPNVERRRLEAEARRVEAEEQVLQQLANDTHTVNLTHLANLLQRGNV